MFLKVFLIWLVWSYIKNCNGQILGKFFKLVAILLKITMLFPLILNPKIWTSRKKSFLHA